MNKHSFFSNARHTTLLACKLILIITAFLSIVTFAQEQTPLDLSVGIDRALIYNLGPIYTLGDVRDIQLGIFVGMERSRQANGVIVTVEIPEGVTVIGAGTDTKPCSYADNLLTCDVGTLVSGPLNPIDRNDIVGIRLKPTRAGTLTLTARISANEPDPNFSNNTSTITVTVIKSRKRARFF